MFEPQTVFVVGAGASSEFGLPVGWGLLEQIRDNSRFKFDPGYSFPTIGKRKIYETLIGKFRGHDDVANEAFLACAAISEGVETAGSIDEFINRYTDHSLIAEMGKIQIAYAIMEAEAKSNLIPSSGNIRDGINWDNAQKAWISAFVRSLFEGVRADEVESIGEDVTIICFNYDRCIEHFLEHAIMRAYKDVDQKTARTIVKRMNIIHPYGWLGSLDVLPFGTPTDNADLYKVSSNLITWSESVEDPDTVQAMKRAVASARNIVFLGFAFANQNMDLLDADLTETNPYFTNFYSTGYGLTSDVETKLKKKIAQLVGRNGMDVNQANRITIKYDMKCKEFMDKQMLNLTV